jgi:hypothetical protein
MRTRFLLYSREPVPPLERPRVPPYGCLCARVLRERTCACVGAPERVPLHAWRACVRTGPRVLRTLVRICLVCVRGLVLRECVLCVGRVWQVRECARLPFTGACLSSFVPLSLWSVLSLPVGPVLSHVLPGTGCALTLTVLSLSVPRYARRSDRSRRRASRSFLT